MTLQLHQVTDDSIRGPEMPTTNDMRFELLSFRSIRLKASFPNQRFVLSSYQVLCSRLGASWLSGRESVTSASVSSINSSPNAIALAITQLQKQYRQLNRSKRRTRTGRSMQVKSKISACTCHIRLVAGDMAWGLAVKEGLGIYHKLDKVPVRAEKGKNRRGWGDTKTLSPPTSEER